MKQSILAFFIFCFTLTGVVHSQDKFYKKTFSLSDVKLLDGPFKHAMDVNIEVLLQYETDRFIAPFRKVSGLPSKAENFPNWEVQGLDGHVGGHYLSAMAIHYAATGNKECLRRMEYMINEFKECQDANSLKYPDWGVGYIGGVPKSEELWKAIKSGNTGIIWQYWVPWYNLHKTYAGLRDAWVYCGNKTARDMFVKFCDWAIEITKGLSDEQMESMLGNEHGGINEVLADAYGITGQEKYLVAAKRFSHKNILNPLTSRIDRLDNLHANTQVPKAVGFQRIAELSGDNNYDKAGSFFWETVTGNRSVAFGGNSRKEFFPPASACIDYINEVEGPESCNTNNMLKLTQVLFRMNPQVKYIDYAERALYNHILSTQHPDHGGYVYFTPVRPAHYRVYSAPNKAMWCCVGTGMENHGKYGEFIYAHSGDSLFVNLFVASELNWKEKKVTLRQETNFPEGESTKLSVVSGNKKFRLLLRYPSWVENGKLEIRLNGKLLTFSGKPSEYVVINRKWKKGDVVEVKLPMKNTIEQLINVPSYIAFMHGPILLASRCGDKDLHGLVAGEGRWEHIASGKKYPVNEAPVLVENNREDLLGRLSPKEGENMKFDLSASEKLTLEPFYKIHDSRYQIYFMSLTNNQYQNVKDSLARIEAERLALDNRTVDFVQPGQQQPESDHFMKNTSSSTGNHQDEFWREARNGGEFSYQMSTKSMEDLTLMIRYWANENGNRTFDITVDDVVLTNVTALKGSNEFRNVEYKIPASLLKGKSSVRIGFKAPQRGSTARIFYLRLLKP